SSHQPSIAPRLVADSMDRPAKLHHSLDNFIRGFQYDKFLPVDEADDRVRSRLDMLDQVRVDHQRHAIDARQLNHEAAIPLQRTYRQQIAGFEPSWGGGLEPARGFSLARD